MRKTLPATFTYEATVRSRPGARTRVAVVREWTEVEVRDLAGPDAPVVARLHLEYRLPGRRLRDASRIPVSLRHDGHGFLEPVMVPGETFTPLTSERYASLAGNRNTAVGGLAWPSNQHMGAYAAVERGSLSGIVSDNRDACLDRLLRAAEASSIVDGVFHKASSEPVYIRSATGHVTAELLRTAKKRADASRIFRADDDDIILDYVSRLPGKMQSGQLDANMVEVLDPSVLTWSRRDGMAIDAARLLVDRMARTLVEAPSRTVLQWLELRDALADGTMETDELVAAAESLLEAGRQAGLGPTASTQVAKWLGAVARQPAGQEDRTCAP